MLNWGFSNYTLFTPKVDKTLIKDVPVISGLVECVSVEVPSISPLLVKKGEEETVRVEVKLCENVEAPVLEKQTLGTVTVFVGKKKVDEYNLVAKKQVEKLTVLSAMVKMFNFISNGDESYPFVN
mgnify:CR=1 FL=1